MADTLRVALAQINTTVGDISGNSELIARYTERARERGAEIVAFPELAITGYPPEDLLLKPSFLADNQECLQQLAAYSSHITMVVGFVDVREDIYNAAAVLHGGEVRGIYHKVYLPNYGVFDEERYFRKGGDSAVYELGGAGVGVSVCEDIWYPTGPTYQQALAGAELLVNINASPYRRGVRAARERMIATRANDYTMYIAYVNTVGGQDELLFDGNSAIYSASGEVVARAPAWKEHLLVADLDLGAVFRRRLHDPRARRLAAGPDPDRGIPTHSLGPTLGRGPKPPVEREPHPELSEIGEAYEGLKVALHDYVCKSRIDRVFIGLSGGIDSSLVAAIAADALGPDKVTGVSMPSRYSSAGSRTDAEQLAANLGIEYLTIPIEEPYGGFLAALAPAFEGTQFGLAEENLQARTRGVILMALANKYGGIAVTAGNKSETSVGYATLYGADTTGGYALLKDVLKTMVYELCRYRNEQGEVIPRAVIEKPPSAELRPDQKDEDSLPPYAVLDPILQAYIEHDHSVDEIVAMGYDRETVVQVIALVDRAEYKRRQSPPGPKLTPRSFGRDRRLPIVNRYSGE